MKKILKKIQKKVFYILMRSKMIQIIFLSKSGVNPKSGFQSGSEIRKPVLIRI
jgi:hypothetical protein